MKIKLLAFASLRELLGGPAGELELRDGATLAELWNELVRQRPQFKELERSTRFARNGELAAAETSLREGDEVALMPPFGGG
jgi:molybdopterin converting factor small subunit